MSFPQYSEYKDSGVEWLGEVPAKWDVAPLKRMLDIQNGADHKGIEQDDGYSVIGSGGPFAYASEYMYDGESVLLGRKGTIDKPLYVTGPFWTVDTMYWTKISSEADGKFCYYTALTIPFDYYSTNTALPSMTKGALGAHLVAVPSLVEQKRISKFLDIEVGKIDGLIGEQEKLITLLKEKRQAVISHAVTKGLNSSVPMKDSGIEWLGDVPANWEVRRLKHVSPHITVGIVVEPSKYYCEEGVPALRSLNVKPGRVSLESMVFISDEANDIHAKSKLRGGDLVAVRSGQPGVTAVVPEELDGCNCIDLIIIRKPSIGDEKFLCWYLASDVAVRQFSEGSGGAIQQHFNIGTAVDLVVVVPPTDEQREISLWLVSEVGKVDQLIMEAEKGIELLRERRSALISAAVTGKIDVRKPLLERGVMAFSGGR